LRVSTGGEIRTGTNPHAKRIVKASKRLIRHTAPLGFTCCCVQYFMKKVQLFSKMSEFEKFINRTDIEIIQVDIKVVEQSFMFQESFAAVVFYKVLS
jgi:hypothetical protein